MELRRRYWCGISVPVRSGETDGVPFVLRMKRRVDLAHQLSATSWAIFNEGLEVAEVPTDLHGRGSGRCFCAQPEAPPLPGWTFVGPLDTRQSLVLDVLQPARTDSGRPLGTDVDKLL